MSGVSEVTRRDYTKLLAAAASGAVAGCLDEEYPERDFDSLNQETLKDLRGEKFSVEAYVAGEYDGDVYFRYRTGEDEIEMREPGRVFEVYGSEDTVGETEPILLLNDHAKYAVGGTGDYRLRVRGGTYFLDKKQTEKAYGMFLQGGASQL